MCRETSEDQPFTRPSLARQAYRGIAMFTTHSPKRLARITRAGGIVFAATLALLAAGCGYDANASVRGQVTLDGKPVEWGSISFVPTNGTKGPLTGSVITNGQYHVPAASCTAVGRYKVEIRWAKKT